MRELQILILILIVDAQASLVCETGIGDSDSLGESRQRLETLGLAERIQGISRPKQIATCRLHRIRNQMLSHSGNLDAGMLADSQMGSCRRAKEIGL
jgi:hypothetical protein